MNVVGTPGVTGVRKKEAEVVEEGDGHGGRGENLAGGPLREKILDQSET